MSYALDTHIFFWWNSGESRLTARQAKILANPDPRDPFLLSDVTLCEIAWLHKRGRIAVNLPLHEWLERAVAQPLIRVCSITPAIACRAANLRHPFPNDPADRIIAATAVVHGVKLITSDQRIIDSGVVETI